MKILTIEKEAPAIRRGQDKVFTDNYTRFRATPQCCMDSKVRGNPSTEKKTIGSINTLIDFRQLLLAVDGVGLTDSEKDIIEHIVNFSVDSVIRDIISSQRTC